MRREHQMPLDFVDELPGARDVRVLIGCEKSGVARRAFARLGFDAWSCDFEPAEDRTNRHMQDDVVTVLEEHGPWDLFLLAHTPCTTLCLSGVRWLYEDSRHQTAAERVVQLGRDAALYSRCWNADVQHVACENPVVHQRARDLIENWQRPSYVQPHEHGDPAFKKTGFTLRNLPALVPTDPLPLPVRGSDEWKRWNAVHRASPGKNRAADRARSFPGIMRAAADQWGRRVLGIEQTEAEAA